MIRTIAGWTLLFLLLLPLAAGAQATAAPTAQGTGAAATPSSTPAELRLEQRMLSLDLVAYKETRQREGLARQRVTDANGVTPSAYAPNLRDPLGRVVRLTFRKMFF